jgi:CheY-like chemotaxis protein
VKLLYVEDNRGIALIVAKTLRMGGHDVTLRHGYADALRVDDYHDVGLFDLSLPDGDGIDLCERLLAERRIGAALFCSGSVDDLLLARAAETAPVIAKDATFAELERALAAVHEPLNPGESFSAAARCRPAQD